MNVAAGAVCDAAAAAVADTVCDAAAPAPADTVCDATANVAAGYTLCCCCLFDLARPTAVFAHTAVVTTSV